MKYFVYSLVLFLAAPAMACGIHQFKVPLNQRGFYNPAALCPYCEGSMYFATGAFAGVGTNDVGAFVTLGNDGDNIMHGAWDFTWSHAGTSNSSVSSYSTRYAWKQYIGSWAMAGGMRASFNSYTMLMVSPENTVASASRNCFSFDAGLYATNQQGFYVGISALNLHQPVLAMKFEMDGQTEYYEIQTGRSYSASAGGLVRLGRRFDMMLDASGSVSDDGKYARPSFLMRYNHHVGIGAGVTVSETADPVFELQGGFTSTSFKWLAGAAFTPQGLTIETGIVARFGVEKWRVKRIESRCVAQPIPEPRKTEFWKED